MRYQQTFIILDSKGFFVCFSMCGIYVHFPFCKSKCIYCNFFSVANLHEKTFYLDALCKEIKLSSNYLNNSDISTIYFGGGTPSLLYPDEIENILSLLNNYHSISNDVEVTLEANPEQLTPSFLSDIRSIGVNRLSIGIQSFSDDILAVIKRRHSVNDSLRALDNAFRAGFDNVSIDLIYGIPYRSRQQWIKELDIAFSFPITHLSAYSLTVEDNTLLDRKIKNNTFLPLNAEQDDSDYELLVRRSYEAGFTHYEISNFAAHGYHSRHNSAYWDSIPYLGLGPSAHSYNVLSRHWNPSNIREYIHNINEGHRGTNIEYLTLEQQFNEYVMLRLRTNKGIDIEYIKSNFGIKYAQQILKNLPKINSDFFSFFNKNTLVLTDAGARVADAVTVDLLV